MPLAKKLLLACCWPLLLTADANNAELLCANLKVYVHLVFEHPMRLFEDRRDSAGRRDFLDRHIDWKRWDPRSRDTTMFGFGPDLTCTAFEPACNNTINGGMGHRVLGSPLSKFLVYDTEHHSPHLLFIRYVIENCLAESPGDADAVVLAFPGNALPGILKSSEHGRKMARKYMESLQELLVDHPLWRRHDGHNYIIPLPRPRLNLKGMQFAEGILNATRVSISSSPREFSGELFLGVPYPTIFHPTSDAEVRRWVDYVSTRPRRREALLLAGGSGTHAFRKPYIDSCVASSNCTFVDVYQFHEKNVDITEQYMDWTFSVQPPGDMPVRKALFDSLLCGCIPILFEGRFGTRFSQQHGFLPRDVYAHFFADSNTTWLDDVALVAKSPDKAMKLLTSVSEERIAELQSNIYKIIPKLLYWNVRRPLDDKTNSLKEYGPQSVQARILQVMRHKLEMRHIV